MIRKTMFLLTALALLGAAPALAAPLLVTLVDVTPDGSNFLWTYTATTQLDEEFNNVEGANNPDFFTIYDFAGFVSFGVVDSDFDASTQLVGVTPPLTVAPDNPSILNLTFTYAPDVAGATRVGPILVSAISEFDSPVLGFYAALTTSTLSNTNNTNVGNVPVPTPEPATLALILAGAPVGLIGFLRRRKKNA
ncbi:MAG: PEP-CTERM sorting domain-containing protein [Pirellulales bacterium]